MRLVIDLHQFTEVYVRVPLCGGKACMAQHFLNLPDVRSRIQEMGCKRMAKAMGTHPAKDPGPFGILFYQPVNTPGSQSPPLRFVKTGSPPPAIPLSSL